ncbi:hypothetical protein [Allofustis seminis]|uniref:hypothetical protein n=1 Tax=Allofustis seminis TaxID=166939 RepID=UPI00035F29ED|nr:hypothetical protein [Allofustis seminis]
MLTFKLISIIDGFYHYEIYPEGDESKKGWIIFNPNTQELKEKIEPDSPFNCFSHFFSSVEDENGNLKESGMAAWY